MNAVLVVSFKILMIVFAGHDQDRSALIYFKIISRDILLGWHLVLQPLSQMAITCCVPSCDTFIQLKKYLVSPYIIPVYKY